MTLTPGKQASEQWEPVCYAAAEAASALATDVGCVCVFFCCSVRNQQMLNKLKQKLLKLWLLRI